MRMKRGRVPWFGALQWTMRGWQKTMSPGNHHLRCRKHAGHASTARRDHRSSCDQRDKSKIP